MMIQDLFDIEPPHQAHSPTSSASAAKIKPKFGKNMVKVLEALQAHDKRGLTDEEGCTATGMTGNSYRPARVKLEQLKLVFKTEATRKTVAGRPAAIYLLTLLGALETIELSR